MGFLICPVGSCTQDVPLPEKLVLPEGVEVDWQERKLVILGRSLLVGLAECSAPVLRMHGHTNLRVTDKSLTADVVEYDTPRTSPFCMHFDIVAGENLHTVDLMICPTQVHYGGASMEAAKGCESWEGNADHTAEYVLRLVDEEGLNPKPADEHETPAVSRPAWIGFEILDVYL